MKKLLKILGILVGVLLLIAVGFYGWASFATSRKLGQTFAVHTVDFPVPYALNEAEAAAVPEAERAAVASAHALERGRHLVQARYVCVECHGQNFGGGTMIDAFPIGTLLGPNITTGRGSRTLTYRATDWDRIVRHGIKPDGTPSMMPSEDFRYMSDQELSDVIAYIRSMPPVDNEVAAPIFGPLGKILLATGQFVVAATTIEHNAAHMAVPPPASASPEFGKHLTAICSGCHRANFAGGPIVGGDPSWVPARNLTPHAEGLASWTYEQFQTAMRQGTRPDGTALQPPMSLVAPYAQRMSDTEIQAMWAYLRTLPALPTNN